MTISFLLNQLWQTNNLAFVNFSMSTFISIYIVSIIYSVSCFNDNFCIRSRVHRNIQNRHIPCVMIVQTKKASAECLSKHNFTRESRHTTNTTNTDPFENGNSFFSKPYWIQHVIM